jgi:hypothetical protein
MALISATVKDPLHAEARKKISGVLKGELDKCHLEKGFPKSDRESLWGWDFAEIAAKHRNKCLSMGNAWDILWRTIYEQFEEVDYSNRPTGKLVAVFDSQKIEELANSILDRIDDLPRPYSFYLRIFAEQGHELPFFNFATSVDLLTVNDDDTLLTLKPKWNEDNPLMRRLFKEKGSEGGLY